jgi:hypothetical protein
MTQPSSLSLLELGVVRRLGPADLRPVFGRYRPAHSELLVSYGLFAVWLGGLAYIMTWGPAQAPTWVSVLAAATGVSLGVLAELFDAASVRVISEQEIAFVAPLAAFSWSVPFAAIQRCDVVVARPHRRLRIFTSRGWVHSLPLTDCLWDSLTSDL